MAIWLESEAEPSPTLDDSLYKLGPIGEDSQAGAPSACPKPSTGHFGYFAFEDNQKPPKRSPTYPFVALGPSQAPILKSLGKVSKVNQKHRKGGAVPSIPNRLVHTESNLTGPHRIRHSSTIDTHNSASFEDTAVWDRKAILSLGMYSHQTLSSLHNGVIWPQTSINQHCPLPLFFWNVLPSLLGHRVVDQCFLGPYTPNFPIPYTRFYLGHDLFCSLIAFLDLL